MPTVSGKNLNLTENTEGNNTLSVSSTSVKCTYRLVCSGDTCGEPLFNPVMINDKNHMVPWLQYHAQDLKQWVGWLLSRPAIEEEVFKAFQRPLKEQMDDIWDTRHLC